MCKEGRIKGVEFVGNCWFAPNGALKSEDPHRVRKNGQKKE